MSKRQIALRVLLPFAAGYFLSYLFRTINAVLSPDLVAELDLAADDLGLLTAAYFITFGAAQLPLGLLLDRYGPRRVEASLLCIAALGALIFALGESRLQLIVGRGLIGLGVSACLMAAFKAFTQWFEPGRLPLINGIIMAAGGLGALVATAPVQAALTITDWRGIFLLLAGLTLIGAFTVFKAVPDALSQSATESLSSQLQGIRTVFSDAFFWKVAPLAMLSQASFISIQSLWSGPWLRDVAGLNRTESADTLLLIACAMTLGFLSIGFLAERLARIGIPPARVSAAGMSIFILIQAVIVIQPADGWYTAVWVLFGFFGTSGIIQYASLSQHFPRHLAGRVNTAINLMVFITAFCMQWASGVIIELWPQTAASGYSAQSYQAAFGLLLSMQLIALAWFLYPNTGKNL
ncbi:MAG: MFS transporter [Gammaproteobacteria bacterium]|nr:MFS transporter [Gammaproteobacteria bacterium]